MNLNIFNTKTKELETTIKALTDDKANLLTTVKDLETKLETHKQTEAAWALAKQDMDKLAKETDAKSIQGLADMKATYEAATETLKSEHAKAIDTLNGEHIKAIETLTKTVADAEQSAGKKAAAITTSMGIPEDNVKPTISATISPTQVLSKLESLNGQERSEFYKKNREQILKALES